MSYLLSHHLAHPHHLVPVSLAIMATPSKSAHVVTSPASLDFVTPKKRRRATTPESPSVLSPALSVVTVSSSASPASRSRLSRSPGSARLRQTNINLRSLYTAYSKEERIREIAFLRATSEGITDVGPRALESPCCVHVCMGRDIHMGACIAPVTSSNLDAPRGWFLPHWGAVGESFSKRYHIPPPTEPPACTNRPPRQTAVPLVLRKFPSAANPQIFFVLGP